MYRGLKRRVNNLVGERPRSPRRDERLSISKRLVFATEVHRVVPRYLTPIIVLIHLR